MDIIARYLTYSDMRLKEIACATGFENPQCFSRFCKRHRGYSPEMLRYRKNNR